MKRYKWCTVYDDLSESISLENSERSMGDTEVRFGMPSSFAKRDQSFIQQGAIGVSERILHSNLCLLESNIDNKTEKYSSLQKTKNSEKSNSYLKICKKPALSKTIKVSEIGMMMTGGGAL